MIHEPREEYHPYDRALKSLMGDHARELLPELLPGCEVEGEENAELNQTTLRADLVYNIRYQGQPRVLDLELQTQPESAMAYRMLAYHVALYGRYRKPVISLVLYPFETTIPQPVFQESAGFGTEPGFKHSVLRVWELEAERYRRRRVVCMYTLLPAMGGDRRDAAASHWRDGAALPGRRLTTAPGEVSDAAEAVQNAFRVREAESGGAIADVRQLT